MYNTAVKTTKETLSTGFDTEYYNKSLKVKNSLVIIGEKALVAINDIPKDIILFYFKGDCTKTRTRTSIQVSHNTHIEVGSVGSKINHSCSPNSKVRTSYNDKTNEGLIAFFSIKSINAGEEITFDYATTETDLTPELASKHCLCNTKNCRGKFFSYTNLPYLFKEKLENEGLLAEHILEMVI